MGVLVNVYIEVNIVYFKNWCGCILAYIYTNCTMHKVQYRSYFHQDQRLRKGQYYGPEKTEYCFVTDEIKSNYGSVLD